MASLVDQVSEKLRTQLEARRAAAREAEVAGRVDHTDAQAQFEARRAQEEAARASKRGPTVPREELNRREAERWDTITVLRDLETRIETERHDLTATLTQAVHVGDLEKALSARIRYMALDGVLNVAKSRLQALGMEVRR